MTTQPQMKVPISTEVSTSTLAPDASLDAKEIIALNEQKELKEFSDWIRAEYKKSKGARQAFERQWYLNMAFYQGRQWVAYAPQNAGLGNKLVVPPAPPYRVRSTTNRVRSVIRTEMSRLTSNKPNASVVPASSEDEDLFAAQAGEQVWESIYANHHLPTIFKRAIFWTVICGTGYIKVWWDKNAVQRLPSGETQKGDIKYAPVTPFHIFVPDLTEEEIENQPFVINAYTKSVDWCKQAYGEDFKPSVISTNELMDNAFLNLRAAGNNAKPDSVLVLEVWLKSGAHKMFPQGGYATLVDNKIVAIHKDGPLFQHTEYPFIKFDHIPTGGFYASSVIEDVIPIQREYNRTRSQIIEAKNRMAKPQLMAPRGSVDASKITSEPGIVIFYRPGLAAPAPLPLQPLPGYVLQELDRSLTDIEDVTSQHQVSKGGAPSGVTAATAISYLQERDDSVLATTYQSVEAGWEKIAKQTLSHVNQFWETTRIVQITGVDGSFDSIALKGSDLTSGQDIRVEAGSALPVSKAARQALLMDLMTQGLIPPDKGLKMMEIGGVNKLYEEMAIDERQAQRENLRMRSLEIQDIEEHLKQAEASLQAADDYQDNQMAQQQPQPGGQSIGDPTPQIGDPINGDPNAMQAPSGPGLPPELMAILSGMGQQQPNSSNGVQTDAQTGEPLLMSQSIVTVNTWDNHALHIEVHNRFRKGQAFELLDDQIKAQIEAHVQMHAQALNQSANQAQMAPPDPNSDPNGGQMPPGMEDSGGAPAETPGGNNQFGPPGSSGGDLPPTQPDPTVGAPPNG